MNSLKIYNVKYLLAWSLHMFTVIYIYRRYCLRFLNWDSTVTYLLFSLYQFMIAFYWIGDYNKDLYNLLYFSKLYTLFIIIFVLNFYIHGAIFHRYLYGRGLLGNTGVWILNIVQSYFQNVLIKQSKIDFLDYLNDEWYNYQLDYNKYYKNKFVFYMHWMSIFFIFLHFYFFLKIIILIFTSPHNWTTFIMIRFEKKILYYFIYFLKLIFFNGLILSLVFKELKYSWALLFFTYETNEDYIYPITQRYDIWEIIGVYGGHHYYETFENIHITKGAIRSGAGRYVFTVKEFKYLFKNESIECFRYRIPKKWNSYKMPELDCIITHNYYFKYWLWFQKYYAITLGIYAETEALNELFHWKRIFSKKEWMLYNLSKSYNNSYKQNKLYKVTEYKLKKYNFK